VKTALAGGTPRMQVEERVEVPASVYAWKSSEADRPKALEVQARNAAALEAAFARGLSIVGYQRSEQDNGTFLLGVWDEAYKY